MPYILGIIPARGGSKGVPRKNIRLLSGKPLLAYTIIEALKSKRLTKTIVSTDDEEIAQVARDYGAGVPLLRPKELATDESLAIETVKHAINFMENRDKVQYDYVCVLQPTSPLRKAEDIDGAIERMIGLGGDSLISVTDVGANHPARMKRIVNDRLVDIFDKDSTFVRKQDLPKVYIFNGALYVACRDTIFDKGSFRGEDCIAYIMPPERSVNIDTELDLIMAEILMQREQARA